MPDIPRRLGVLFLAQDDLEAVRLMGKSFREQGAPWRAIDLFWLVLLIASVAALVAALRWLYQQHDRRSRLDSPRGLFLELCRAHALDRRERRLIEQVARRCGADSPAQLFVEPGLLLDAAESDAFARDRATIRSLESRIFEGLDGNEPAPRALAGSERF